VLAECNQFLLVFSRMTPATLLKVKFGKSLVRDQIKGKKLSLCKKTIH